MSAILLLVALIATMLQGAQGSETYVRYLDIGSGAAVLVRGIIPAAEGAALIPGRSGGKATPRIVATWTSSAPDLPVAYDASVTCHYIDPGSWTTLTTDCVAETDRVLEWLRMPGARDDPDVLGRVMSTAHGKRLIGYAVC